jgi:hypothetical protein
MEIVRALLSRVEGIAGVSTVSVHEREGEGEQRARDAASPKRIEHYASKDRRPSVGPITRSLQRLWRINTTCVARGVGLWGSTPHACAQEADTVHRTHTIS